MTAPKRIQRKRTKNWRLPRGAVIVDRTSHWGNPYIIGDLFNGGNIGRNEAVMLYRLALIEHRLQYANVARVRAELAGHDLACWCPLDQPCHADVLLDIANPTPTEQDPS